jgi:ketosteroid isomerase-like protein
MMNTLIAEQPLLSTIFLSALAIGFGYAWLQLGKRAFGIASIVFALLIPGAWALAHYWETDREKLQKVIYDTAEAVQTNDIDRAVQAISDQHASLVSRARTELANYKFTQAKVTNIRSIQINNYALPLQADVEMMASVTVSAKSGQFSDIHVPRRLSLRFEKTDDGRWVVVDYDHGPAFGERDGYSGNQLVK